MHNRSLLVSILILVTFLFLVYMFFLSIRNNTNKVSSPASTEKSYKTRPTINLPKQRDDFVSKSEKAIKTTTISIKNCKATPEIIKMGYNKILTIINTDTISHSLKMSKNHIIQLNANETKKITAKFDPGQVQFTFSCDKVENAGTIFLQ